MKEKFVQTSKSLKILWSWLQFPLTAVLPGEMIIGKKEFYVDYHDLLILLMHFCWPLPKYIYSKGSHFHNVPSEVKQGQVFNHKGLSRQLLPKKQLFMVLICYCKHSRNLSVKFVSDMLSDSMRHLGPYYQIWPLARSQRMWVFSYIWN